jgi:thiamine pyrophosphokinase
MHSCLVVGGAPGKLSSLDYILQACTFDAVFAVDAGYAALQNRGVAVQGVFGDFDSLGYIPNAEAAEETNTQLEVFSTHKDFTDMDWALNHASKQGFDNIVMCGGLSARLDHSLGNLALMAAAAHQGQRVWGITEEEVVLTLDGESGLSNIAIDAGAWGTCSVLSHSDEACGVCETGLEYSITNGRVSNRQLWGISNELIGAPASISLTSGSMWVFLPLKELHHISYTGAKLCQ